MIDTENAIVPLSCLIHESINGNQKMQKKLYEQFAEKMYAVCFGFTGNRADAEDILQQGFIKVFRHLNKYRGDGSFEGWIRKIITRTAITHITRSKKFSFLSGIEHFPEDSSCNILSKLAEKDIVGLITKLPLVHRRVFLLYAVEGYNHREIAAMLGCSEGTCKSQFYRSRTKLQKLLKMIA